MADDKEKRLAALQDEIKLLKGELKNSLASVREYLLNMELPSSEFSTILAALSGDGSAKQEVTMGGNIGNQEPEQPGASEIEEETEQEVSDEPEPPPEDEDLIDVENPEEEVTTEELTDENPEEAEEISNEEEDTNPEEGPLSEESEEENLNPEEGEDFSNPDNETTPESELAAEEEQHMGLDQSKTEINHIPKVNMMANLINWIARAKKEVGYEQLPTLLDVYGISGYLTPELKEIIIQLAEITKERPEAITDAEIWSQSMLSLHGILTGGDAPLHPVVSSLKESDEEVKSSPEEEIIEVDKSKEKPVKLKLVFPNSNGKDKEFCINLVPDEDSSSS